MLSDGVDVSLSVLVRVVAEVLVLVVRLPAEEFPELVAVTPEVVETMGIKVVLIPTGTPGRLE